MAEYAVRAKVDQIVTREICLLVTASSGEMAEEKAREVLQEFPDKTSVKGVRKCLATKTKFWIPRDIDILEVVEEKDVA